MFDSLLAKLKGEVSEVSQVRASNSKACGRYSTKTGQVSEVSTGAGSVLPDTHDTSCNPPEGSLKPMPLVACTPDTSDTPEKTATDTDTLKVGADYTAMVEPFDREAFEERAVICEFGSGLTRADTESLAWREDDRRRCTQCQNRRAPDGLCRIAEPKAGALVVANRSYAPDPVLPRRCEGYSPKASDLDQRPGAERWPGLFQKGGE